MEKLKDTLGRKVGPFSVGVWVIVIVVGVGVAFAIKRRYPTTEPDYSGVANVPQHGNVAGGGLIDSGQPLPGTQGALPPSRPRRSGSDNMQEIRDSFGALAGLITDRASVKVPAAPKSDPGIEGEKLAMAEATDGIDRSGTRRPPNRGITPPSPLDVDEVLNGGGPKTKPREAITPPVHIDPFPSGGTYVVRKGDWLSKIAGKYPGVSWQEIYEANRALIGGDPDLIRPGQKLVIPGGR